jgi:hypothetical protein
MIIYFKDGSTLECNEIQIFEKELFCDDYLTVFICDVERIETA